MKNAVIQKLALVSVALTLVVVVLGAYVRLSDAGLGCPDWPGCYGQIGVPSAEHEVAAANSAYPERPVEAHKAWKEMIHRYAASTLGLLIVVMAGVAWFKRKAGVSPWLPTMLVALVIFQGLLGMWTVTLLVQPVIVTAHLLGGMTTLALLWWLFLEHSDFQWQRQASSLSLVRGVAFFALLVLVLQIALGGWTSTHYAALACYGFPTCNGEWWPQSADFADAYSLWHELAPGQRDFEGGILHQGGRVAIHLSHRIGAVLATLGVAWLAVSVYRRASAAASTGLKGLAVLTLLALLVQLSLGIGNVFMQLPLWMATAHNGGAAVLLLGVVTLVYASTLRGERS
ncbi:cytochrome oxidase assembly family protein/cell division protein FtsY [gamma proteobacterium HTCC5015]|nr:cytochrome oxidase assembly family protein/cell division protein FtsY [gamma proteobacterium HTCC5015]